VIAIPAVDLREGACVQLVGGDYAAERVRLPDPLAVARRWLDAGFRRLHVVDLDAATGRGDNGEVVARLAALPGATVQAGGGLGDEARAARVLDAGAAAVVVGTRAVADPAWLEALATRHPGRVIVAADVRGREVLVRGWAAGSGLDVLDLAARVDPLPLAGLLVTAVHQEGRLAGPDLALVRAVAGRSRHPVQASGGIGGLDDLRDLERAGAAGAVIGMALYVGALDPATAAREFPA
jgi:phosphoribosyl isomerase A